MIQTPRPTRMAGMAVATLQTASITLMGLATHTTPILSMWCPRNRGCVNAGKALTGLCSVNDVHAFGIPDFDQAQEMTGKSSRF